MLRLFIIICAITVSHCGSPPPILQPEPQLSVSVVTPLVTEQVQPLWKRHFQIAFTTAAVHIFEFYLIGYENGEIKYENLSGSISEACTNPSLTSAEEHAYGFEYYYKGIFAKIPEIVHFGFQVLTHSDHTYFEFLLKGDEPYSGGFKFSGNPALSCTGFLVNRISEFSVRIITNTGVPI